MSQTWAKESEMPKRQQAQEDVMRTMERSVLSDYSPRRLTLRKRWIRMIR